MPSRRPSRIAEIQDIALEYEITTIFYETLVSPAVAESIAGDLGLRTDVLDPIEGITPESRGQDYLAVMDANLAALQKANGCSLRPQITADPVTGAGGRGPVGRARRPAGAARDQPDGPAGEAVALLGGNGSGKSTLVRTLLGLHPERTRHGPALRRAAAQLPPVVAGRLRPAALRRRRWPDRRSGRWSPPGGWPGAGRSSRPAETIRPRYAGRSSWSAWPIGPARTWPSCPAASISGC